MEKKEKILIIDFGGQYKQLIARRVRELNVYSEVRGSGMSVEEIRAFEPDGIIFTGGPSSVYEAGAPTIDDKVLELGIPILGICYGCQLIMHMLGGKVENAVKGEYGKAELVKKTESELLNGIDVGNIVWMSHMDLITEAAPSFCVTSATSECPVASVENPSQKLYGVQFHPEVSHTENGLKIIENFVKHICKLEGLWRMDKFVKHKIDEIKQVAMGKKVLLALSGGVDSSVVAALIHKAIGKNLTCIFVDHGLLRMNEADEVERIFRDKFDLNLIRVDAEARFLGKLAGVTDPEKKRKIIGEEFIRVFEEEAKKLGKMDFLAQGTIYPDVIESGLGGALIKSHHNVGGLPEHVDFEDIMEPLRELFKDEVRLCGLELGLPPELVYRQPFPGPGLAVRVIGEITKEKLDILRPADKIFRDEIAKSGLDKVVGQYFAVLTDMKSVGVKGDERSYDYILALRAVDTTDFMTAEYSKLPHDLLERTSGRILSECKRIGRIVYDITGKPPGTIEWE